MTTPDQSHDQGLTRKQLREIKMTGATPIVTIDDEPESVPEVASAEPLHPAPVPVAEPVAHLPRPAAPLTPAPAPQPDSHVDLAAAPLTRRQAREQERIRTASVPVITADLAAAYAASQAPAADETPETAPEEAPIVVAEVEPEQASAAAEEEHDVLDEVFGTAEAVEASEAAGIAEAAGAEERAAEPAPVEPAPEARAVVDPGFGSELLATASKEQKLAPSFDELVARNTVSTGSVATPSALILTQPNGAPLTAPVAATGEIIVTGSFVLPEGLASRGHAVGTTDGREVDAVLLDGEIPAASSPTPISASAAISTVKGTGEIIRPPAPEKGNKVMLSLAITAGVLAAALISVMVVAFVTGVFS